MTLARWGAALIAGLIVASAVGQAKQPPAAKTAKTETPTDEQAIRATADAYVKAFNAGDAKAVAAFWTTTADYVDEQGKVCKGRDAIEKEYAALFAAHPGLAMKLDIESIRLLNGAIAMEDGRSTLTLDGRKISQNRYSAVHVKQNGAWLLSAVRDMPDLAATDAELHELDFLVGDWAAQRDETTVKSNFKWTIGKHFLYRTYVVVEQEHPDAPKRSGLQIIAWDPSARQLRSWTFDSTGGFGQGLWSRADGGWSIETEGVLADGSLTASTELVERVNDNIIGWQSVNRTAAGQQLPDTEQVVLERVGVEAKTAP